MDRPAGELTAQPADHWFWLWDAYILVVYAICVVTTMGETDWPVARRLGAAGALTALVLWYALFGRPVIRSGDRCWRAHTFVAGVIGLLAAETMFVPSNSTILFAVYPMIFMAIRPRFAVAAVLVASALPSVALLLQHLMDDHYLGNQVFLPLIGVAVASLMSMFIARTTDLSDQRAELIEQLRASQAEVARLSHEAGMAAERGRLAREIHDTLAQGFTSIVTLLQAAESELDGERAKVGRHLELAVRTARENLGEARALVAGLSPSALDGGTLEDTVRRQVERLGEETGIAAGYRTAGPPAELPTALEVVLLRGVQEALSNVRKHSGARTVNVTLRFTGDAVTLTVVDDGNGLPTTGGCGFGLRGMRERAEQVSGRLAVHGTPGKGTRLELEVPR